MATLPVTNGTKKAIMDDTFRNMVAPFHWFVDQGHIYTRMSFPTGKAKPFPKSFTLKVRLDFYIFGLLYSHGYAGFTSHVNFRVSHKNGDPYDCTLDNLAMKLKDPGTRKNQKTIYLGVYLIPTDKDTPYEMRYIDKQGQDCSWRYDKMYDLARDYDYNVRADEGNEAEVNFLLQPQTPRVGKGATAKGGTTSGKADPSDSGK